MTGVSMIDVAGRATRVRLSGDPADPPVVLLHGVGRSLEDWSATVPRLARRYRVISLDLPGFGFSARRPGPTSLVSFALGVLETLDALGEERPVHLMGNSLGGTIALQLQAVAPERVSSLVLADPAGFGSRVNPMLRLVAAPLLGRLMTMRTTPLGAKLAERMALADPALATSARIEHALEIAKQPGPGAVMREAVRSLGTVRGIRAEWRHALVQLVARHPRPTLVVWGARDRLLPVAHLDEARRLIPHARTHVFAEAGHMPQVECPSEFVELADAFIVSTDVRT